MPDPLSSPPYPIHILESGTFGLDGGAMFGSVPKELWERTNPADEANRIELALRLLIIEGDGRRILVDTGMGTLWTEQQVKRFRIEQPGHPVDSALEAIGFNRQDVTDVILTHLHFDHAGGATLADGREIVPAFPNARYYTQRSQWDLANNPSPTARATVTPPNFVLL